MSDKYQLDPSDLRAFREATREEVRRLFTEFREESPDETFYVFGLFDYVDWGCPCLFHGANTLQHWKLELAQKVERAQKGESKVELPDEFYKWAAGCWKGECMGNLDSMEIVSEIMTKAGLDDYEECDEFEECRYLLRLSVEVEMMLALRELDDEHFFGQGEQRNQMLLTVSDEDEGAADDWRHEISAYLLNPEDVFRKFLVEFRRGNREPLTDIDAYIQEIERTDHARLFRERLAS